MPRHPTRAGTVVGCGFPVDLYASVMQLMMMGIRFSCLVEHLFIPSAGYQIASPFDA